MPPEGVLADDLKLIKGNGSKARNAVWNKMGFYTLARSRAGVRTRYPLGSNQNLEGFKGRVSAITG